jgi:hypothetical protein
MGGGDVLLADWDEVVKVQNQATLDGSPTAQAVIKFMEDKEEYTATSSALHKSLGVVAEELGLDKDRAWPKSARWLWRRIKEVLPVLAAAGIEATRGRDESAKQITLRKLPTNDGSDGSRRESRADKGETHANSDPDDGRSNGSENPASSAGSANTANRYGNFSETARLSIADVLEEMNRPDTGAAKNAELYRRGEITAENAVEWITKAVLVRRGMDAAGWERHAPAVEAALTHPLDCDCEECQ